MPLDMSIFTFDRHNGKVNAVSSSGNLTASCSDDNTIMVWNVEKDEPRCTLKHDYPVGSVAISPDSALVASVSDDGIVRIWSTEGDNGPLFQKKLHEIYISEVAFSPNGEFVASCARDKTVKVWRFRDNDPPVTIEDPDGYGIESVVFSADSKQVAYGTEVGPVKVCKVDGSDKPRTLSEHTKAVSSVTFTSKGAVASCSYDQTIRIRNIDGSDPQIYQDSTDVYAVAFSVNGVLASGGHDGLVKVWDPETKTPRLVLQGHIEYINSVTFISDGLLASGSADATAKVWKIDDHDYPLYTYTNGGGRVVLSRDGTYIASNSYEPPTVNMWRTESGINAPMCSYPYKLDPNSINGLAISPDNTQLAVSLSSWFDVWKIGDNNNLVHSPSDKGDTSIAFSPNGDLAVCPGEGEMQLWKPESIGGEPDYTYSLPSVIWSNVHSIAFPRDTKYMACGKEDGRLNIWHTYKGGHIPHYSFPHDEDLDAGPVYSVAFAKDESLASGGADGKVKIWILGDEDPDGPFRTFDHRIDSLVDQAAVSSIAFSEDGKYVVSGGNDGRVKVWNISSGEDKPVRTYIQDDKPDPERSHTFVDISENGLMAISGSYKPVQIWRWDL